MILKKTLYFFILFIGLNLFAQPDIQKEDFHIFILMGQSNMSGFATLEPADTISQRDMYNLLGQKKSKWGTKFKKGTESTLWIPAKHPLHAVHNSDNFGMAIDFGKAYLKKHPNVKIGFIPCAWGGAPIEQLEKGTAIYKNAMERITYAKEAGTIKGVLWHQGESNTVNEELANSYENKLHRLIKNVRKDIKIKKLPFVVGDLANFYGIGRTEKHIKGIITVRNVLRTLPNKVKNTAFVESTGLSWEGDGHVHFDRKAYIELGKRYEQEYSSLK